MIWNLFTDRVEQLDSKVITRSSLFLCNMKLHLQCFKNTCKMTPDIQWFKSVNCIFFLGWRSEWISQKRIKNIKPIFRSIQIFCIIICTIVMIVMHSDCTLIFCNYHHSLIQSLFCIIVKSYILLYSTQRQYDINISDVIIFMTLFMHCINEKLFKMDSVHKGENIFISTEIFCIVICIIAKHAFSPQFPFLVI